VIQPQLRLQRFPIRPRRGLGCPSCRLRSYAQALLAVGPTSPQERERALAARMRREQILDRDDGTAPRLVAMLTEASLMYLWGSQQDDGRRSRPWPR
jgi:Domain of unknown function (DUF5753)